MKINKLRLSLILTISLCSLSSPLFCLEQETDFEVKNLTSLPFKGSIDKVFFSESTSAILDDRKRKPVVKSAIVKPSYCPNSLGDVIEGSPCTPTPISNGQDILLSLSLRQPYQFSSQEMSYPFNHLLKNEGDKHNPFSFTQPITAISFRTLKLPSPVLKPRAALLCGKSLLLKTEEQGLSGSKP